MRFREVLQYLKYDLRAYRLYTGGGDSILIFLRSLLICEFRLVVSVRLYQYLHQKGFTRVSYLMYQRCIKKYSVDISPTASLGRGFRVVHPFNIVIGGDAVISEGVKVFNGVTLGKKQPWAIRGRMPTIGAYCILGSGCKVVGDVHVESGSVIGANKVVTNREGLQSKGTAVISNTEYVFALKELLNSD